MKAPPERISGGATFKESKMEPRKKDIIWYEPRHIAVVEPYRMKVRKVQTYPHGWTGVDVESKRLVFIESFQIVRVDHAS